MGLLFYRTKNGIEKDLILEGRFGLLPVEIKSGVSISPGNLNSLAHFIEQESLPLGIVINNDNEVKMLRDKIIQIPASMI